MPNSHYIWKLQVIETELNAVLKGVILRKHPGVITERDNTLSTFSKILGSYLLKPTANTAVKITDSSGKSIEIVTDENGEFECAFSTEESHFKFFIGDSKKDIPVIQNYPVRFKNESYPYLLVSDIDDTILISKASKALSSLRLLLLNPSIERKTVEPTEQAFEVLRKSNKVQFAYVSNSELNLFHLLTSFFTVNHLPKAPLLLRPWTTVLDLITGRKTPESKQTRIKKLMEWFPNKKLILFGDDSQEDLNVFSDIARDYPERLHSVFLHKTGLTDRYQTLEFESRLPDSDHNLYYYDSFEDIKPTIEELLNETVDSH